MIVSTDSGWRTGYWNKAMDAGRHETQPLDYSTRLPPRKRLLAGLKKQKSAHDSPPLCFHSSALHARVQELLDLSISSPDEVIEASKSIVLDAEETAAVARATALEKAAIAVRAKAYARSVLELVAYVSRTEVCEENSPRKTQGKKKHVAVELLYKSNRSIGTCEADEELARRLHQAMNSSPRILRKRSKRHGNSVKCKGPDGHVTKGRNSLLLCNRNSELTNVDSLSKAEDGALTSSESVPNHKDQGSAYSSEKSRSGFKSAGRRGRIKKKKLLLSQCCSREGKDTKDSQECEGQILSKESALDSTAENLPPVLDNKFPNVDDVSEEAESLWKRKKLKLSQKVLHPLFSKPRVVVASALVKVD